jgi:hypothetical protein
MIVELTLLPLALACVALRLWIRIRWLNKSWWDDWLMVVAAVRSPIMADGPFLILDQIFSCGTTTVVILGNYLESVPYSRDAN